jgi:hypothetical protein
MKAIKITVNTPSDSAHKVREAIGKAGAGVIGKYSFCSFSTKGIGRSIPLNGAKPFIGGLNQLEEIEEEKIETFCEPNMIKKVVAAIKNAHPYEEPAISTWEIEVY